MKRSARQHQGHRFAVERLPLCVLLGWGALTFSAGCGIACAQSGSSPDRDRRAAPPLFDQAEVESIFFSSLSEAIRGRRPALGEPAEPLATPTTASARPADDRSASLWADKIDAVSLEDEIKRIRQRFDQSITTPAAFRGGGYQDAALNLSILATLFAVVADYEQDVRWKDDAAAARDLLARSARNAQSGTIQVYNEAKKRTADLQDLLSGAGLPVASPGDQESVWSMVADRTPLMAYAEELLDALSAATRDEATTKQQADVAVRQADLLTMLGIVISREGMGDADDPDYVAYCDAMSESASDVKAAIRQERWNEVRPLVGTITQSCSRCHEDYR